MSERPPRAKSWRRAHNPGSWIRRWRRGVEGAGSHPAHDPRRDVGLLVFVHQSLRSRNLPNLRGRRPLRVRRPDASGGAPVPRTTLGGRGAVIPDAAKLWRPMLVLGALNAALPYFTISWGTQSFPAAPPPYSTPPSRSSPSYSPSSCPPSPPNASALLASSAFCSAHSVSACSSAASTASMVARPSPERALCSSGLQGTPPETSTPAAR